MTSNTILPKGEDLRKAVRYVSEKGVWNYTSIEEASRRFNLSPKDEEFLIQFFLNKNDGKDV